MREDAIELQAYLSSLSYPREQLLKKLKEDRDKYKYHYVGTFTRNDILELIDSYLDILEGEEE